MEKLIEQLLSNRGKIGIIGYSKQYTYQAIGVEILKTKYLYNSLSLRNKNTAILYNDNQKAEASIRAISMLLLGINTTLIPVSAIKDKIWRLRDVLLKTRTSIVIGPKEFIINDTLVSTWINLDTLDIVHSNFELYNSLTPLPKESLIDYDNEFLKIYDLEILEETKLTVLNPGVNQPEKESIFELKAIREGIKRTKEMNIYNGKETISIVPSNIDKPYVLITSVLVPLILGGRVVFSSSNPYDIMSAITKHNANFVFIEAVNFKAILKIMIGKSNVFGKLKILWYMKLFMPKLKNVTLYGEISQDTKKVLNKSRIQKTLCYTMIENSCIIASKQYKTLKKEITLSPKISLKLANLGGESEILITDKTILHSYTKDNKFVHSKEEFKTGDIGSLKKGELHILGSSEAVILDIRTHTVLNKEIIDDYLSKFKFIAESVIVKKQNELFLLIDLDIEYCIEKKIVYQDIVSKLPKMLKEMNTKLRKIFGVFEFEKIIISPKKIEKINGKIQIWKYSIL